MAGYKLCVDTESPFLYILNFTKKIKCILSSINSTSCTMFKKLLEKIGKQQLFWPATGEKNNEVIDYGNFFATVSSALILMPEQLDNFGVAINRHRDLAALMPKTQFVLFIREKYVSLIPSSLQKNIVQIRESDITPIGVPNRRFLKSTIGASYDLIIDFNTDFDLVATYICKKTKAKLRICLCHPQREPFYNLQFCTSDSDTIDEKIEVMVKYISQFLAIKPDSKANLQPV